MPDPVVLESRTAQIASNIEKEVARYRTTTPLQLPQPGSAIVKDYVRKIEGTYDVRRAKTDTDNAVDLLYIAYNTTPQEEGAIRVKIGRIMDQLIEAQGASERTMADAMRTAENVVTSIKNTLPDWQDAKESGDPARIKAFIADDLLELAGDIKRRALGLKEQLLTIAASYDAIIAETAAASAISETALSGRLADQQALLKEIAEAQAERDQIDALVADLKEEVRRFEAKARQYEERATTAEQRAFVMQIVKIGAQVVGAALPPIAMAAGAAATGGASVIAASTLGALAPPSPSKGDETPKPDTTAETIKTKGEIAQKKKELELADKKVAESKEKVEGLRKDLKAAQETGQKTVEVGTAKETVVQGDDGEEVKAIKERLKEAKQTLAGDEQNSQALQAALAGLQASLSALAQGLGELTQEQKDEAASLREIQMRMLDKAEAYERERREQAAKLVKINALLKGRLEREDIVKLAVKSLNISLAALKRTKEIVEEIAFFFKSFADFMEQVAEEARTEIALIESVSARTTLGRNRLEQLVASTDELFIRQTGEWRAVHVVADTFNQSFAAGRTRANKLNGTYIQGDELKAYLARAAEQLREISDAREAAARARLVDLELYRRQLRDTDTQEDPQAA